MTDAELRVLGGEALVEHLTGVGLPAPFAVPQVKRSLLELFPGTTSLPGQSNKP
jgi:hypothetical protein